jgi:predicted nucleic acid-binding protein
VSGLRKLSRPDVFIVVDTMVLLKALADILPFSDTLECIRKKCDRIVLSTNILREYKCKATAEGMTLFILLRKVKELQRIGKTRRINHTQIEYAKSLIEREKLPLPSDKFDHKFFEAAIACNAKYIITADNGSLALDPYDHNSVYIRIVDPIRYTQENCPNN